MAANQFLSLPAVATGLTPESSASAWGFGSWVQVTAGLSSQIKVNGFQFQVTYPSGALDTTFQILFEIGEGTAGNEVVQAQVPFSHRLDTTVGYYLKGTVSFPEPILIDAGVRIAVRATDSITSVVTYQGVKLIYEEIVGNTYNETTSVSSDHQVSTLLDLSLNPTINLSSDSIILISNIAELLGTSSLSSDAQITIINELIIEVVSILNQDSNIISIGGLNFMDSTSLLSDNTLNVNTEVTLSETIVLSSDSLFVVSLILELSTIISLLVDNIISGTNDATLNNNININLDAQKSTFGNINIIESLVLSTIHSVITSGNIDFNTEIDLSSINEITLNNLINANETIAIAVDNLISLLSNLEINSSSLMSTENLLSVSNNTEINDSTLIAVNNLLSTSNQNELQSIITLVTNKIISITNTAELSGTLSLQTDSGFSENGINELLTQTTHLSNHNIDLTNDVLSSLILSLISLSNLSPEEQLEGLAQIELSLNNEVLFGSIMEVYNQAIIQSIAGIVISDYIPGALNDALGLNLSAEAIFLCSQLFDNDIVLTADASVLFTGTIPDYSDNEILSDESKITIILKTKSLICNALFNESLISTISYFKSKITTEIKDKSIIITKLHSKSKIK